MSAIDAASVVILVVIVIGWAALMLVVTGVASDVRGWLLERERLRAEVRKLPRRGLRVINGGRR